MVVNGHAVLMDMRTYACTADGTLVYRARLSSRSRNLNYARAEIARAGGGSSLVPRPRRPGNEARGGSSSID